MSKFSRFRKVTTFEEVKKVVEFCKQTGYASIDFETRATGPLGPSIGEDKNPTGPHHKEDAPTLIGISFQPGSGFGIPLFHKESPFSPKECLQILHYIGKELCENINVIKVCWNLKFEYKWFLRYGHTMQGLLLDGMLMKYLLEEVPPNDLKSMAERYYPDFADYEDEVKKAVVKYKGWGNIPMDLLLPYCVTDCDITLRLVLLFEPKVIKNGFYNLFRNMCMMQVRVLAESEMMGLPIDVEYLDELIVTQGKRIEVNLRRLMKHSKVRNFQRWRVKQKVKKLIKETSIEIEEIKKDKTKRNPERLIKSRQEKISRYIAGQLLTKKEVVGDFNLNSPDQVVDFLYVAPGGLRLPVIEYTKDKQTKQPTNRPSTAEETLLKLKKKDKSGFLTGLLNHREMSKLYSTYMVGIRRNLTSEKYTLHGEFRIHGTVTGRLSSRNPNLQNLPRTITSSLIKRMFIPPPGHLLVEVDYGQAELRVVAELANDTAMIEIFQKNYNVHVATGAKINHKFQDYDKIKAILSDDTHPDHTFWEKQKKRGKVLNFSILYLQSDKMTAEQMGVSEREAAKFKQEWFGAFPRIKEWMDEQEERLMEDGYVMNMFGRKRRLPDIWDNSKGKRNAAIREAINSPIQGASSDFTQFASINIRERALRGDMIWTEDIKYLKQAYTVHDSLGFFVQPKYIHTVVPIINKICSDPETLKYFNFKMHKVQMKVSPEVGVTWGALKDYNKDEDYTKLLSI